MTDSDSPEDGPSPNPARQPVKHELIEFRTGVTAICSCGWTSAASTDQAVLVQLWEIHQR